MVLISRLAPMAALSVKYLNLVFRSEVTLTDILELQSFVVPLHVCMNVCVCMHAKFVYLHVEIRRGLAGTGFLYPLSHLISSKTWTWLGVHKWVEGAIFIWYGFLVFWDRALLRSVGWLWVHHPSATINALQPPNVWTTCVARVSWIPLVSKLTWSQGWP